jgi:hypothetical protein
MKTANEVSYRKVILYGLVIELVLIFMQLIYMTIHKSNDPQPDFMITKGYLQSNMFYAFQIFGFIVFLVTAYLLCKKIFDKLFTKVLVFVLTASIVELAFYLIIQSDYSIVLFYSFLSNFFAAALGGIFYLLSTEQVKEYY